MSAGVTKSDTVLQKTLCSVSARFRVNSTGRCKPNKTKSTSDMHDKWHSTLEVKNAFAENSLRYKFRKTCDQIVHLTITHSKGVWLFLINVYKYIFLSY